MMDHESEIRAFIAERFLFGADLKLESDESFLESGVIDSMGVLELIAFLEDRYKIRVNDDELVPENLDSIKGICGFLDKKLLS
jgi:acyl carrier protein